MSLLGFIPNIVGGIVSSSMDASSGMTSARMARTAYRHRYQDTVQDMRKAGLNPALAYGQGGGSGAQGQSIPELGTSFARGAGTVGAIRQQDAAADLTSAQSALLKAQSLDLIDQVRLRNEALKTEMKLTTAKTATEQKRPQQIQIAIDRASQQKDWETATWRERVEMVFNQRTSLNLDLDRKEIENYLLGLERPEARARADFYSGAGKYSPYLNSALDVLKALMPKINIGPKNTPRPINIYPGRR